MDPPPPIKRCGLPFLRAGLNSNQLIYSRLFHDFMKQICKGNLGKTTCLMQLSVAINHDRILTKFHCRIAHVSNHNLCLKEITDCLELLMLFPNRASWTYFIWFHFKQERIPLNIDKFNSDSNNKSMLKIKDCNFVFNCFVCIDVNLISKMWITTTLSETLNILSHVFKKIQTKRTNLRNN